MDVLRTPQLPNKWVLPTGCPLGVEGILATTTSVLHRSHAPGQQCLMLDVLQKGHA